MRANLANPLVLEGAARRLTGAASNGMSYTEQKALASGNMMQNAWYSRANGTPHAILTCSSCGGSVPGHHIVVSALLHPRAAETSNARGCNNSEDWRHPEHGNCRHAHQSNVPPPAPEICPLPARNLKSSPVVHSRSGCFDHRRIHGRSHYQWRAPPQVSATVLSRSTSLCFRC